MLKLPKGLKKKKKGKKSKKNQELFTEEELETYKRDQRDKQLAAAATEEEEVATATTTAAAAPAVEKKPTDDDEWSRFNALTTGIDTVLKKTQGDLDRIKESSFFQRVAPKKPEPPHSEAKAEAATSASTTNPAETTAAPEEEPQTEADRLAQAVIELSESEEESDEADDIFDTNYIDVITSGEVPLAYVQDSPTEDVDVGPDPFDTSYAEQVVKGPEVSKRGKKIVNIGSAVEVLTGRIENRSTVTARRPRRGPQNLLLESFDDFAAGDHAGGESEDSVSVQPIAVKTLLDDTDDDFLGGPIDLSVSLHIALQKEQKPVLEEETKSADVSEFDVLNNQEADEDDEFAELAAESLTKKEEVQKLSQPQVVGSVKVAEDWAAFAAGQEAEQKKKPARPQPPCIAQKQQVEVADEDEDDDSGIDPFDTTFAEKVLPEPEDFDFDPRAEERRAAAETFPVASPAVAVKPVQDLLAGSNPDLTNLSHIPIIPTESFDQQTEIDPFDTSAVNSIVLPKAAEIKFLEKELLSGPTLTAAIHHSLSDPDFDPRAEEESVPELKIRNDYQETARRKSSLSLNIGSSSAHKSVVFVNKIGGDLLSAVDDYSTGNGKIQKPLTPYYNNQPSIEEKESEDPFDTSFVSNPSSVEISLLERDLIAATAVANKLSHSLSDQDFDPRGGATPAQEKIEIIQPDLLAVSEEHNIKVLTPASGARKSVTDDSSEITFVDPFDTSSIDRNILPGRAELKLLESELLPTSTTAVRSAVLDTYTDSEELGLGDKVLTPYLSTQSTSVEDIDPFDTSFASNLAPGSAEIKVLEKQLID